jgi:hypothetical protein
LLVQPPSRALSRLRTRETAAPKRGVSQLVAGFWTQFLWK